jgi:predicted ABC-type ATPase
MTPAPPLLHILAGPNGAGKSSLYHAHIQRLTDAEFVNADLLVRQELGRHAASEEDAKLGQALAEKRRAELLAARQSLVTESTFSHSSKVDLVRTAKEMGYRVVIYHVSVDSVDLAVARVNTRVSNDGHPVPEDRIRGRYERNGPLIREAILLAGRGYVFDNSRLGEPPRRLITFVDSLAIQVVDDLPKWAADLYADDIAASGAK